MIKKKLILFVFLILFLVICNFLIFIFVEPSLRNSSDDNNLGISNLELKTSEISKLDLDYESEEEPKFYLYVSSLPNSRNSRKKSHSNSDNEQEETLEDEIEPEVEIEEASEGEQENNSSSNEEIKSNIEQEIYIGLYVGDIDGQVSDGWFYFYQKLLNFYNENEIPVSFSFYPVSIENNTKFNEIFAKIYVSEYVELIQKGYRADEAEMKMDELSFEEQKKIIQDGQEHFKEKMKEILNETEIELPTAYNQIHGRFTNDTRQACIGLGFEMFFEMFLEDDLEPVESTEDFYVIQYGVGFTKDGSAGRETEFWEPKEIFKQINEFDREDLTVLTIDNKKVIPLWLHQQDFEDKEIDEKVNEKKWEDYTKIILALKQDSNVTFVTPKDIYDLRKELGP